MDLVSYIKQQMYAIVATLQRETEHLGEHVSDVLQCCMPAVLTQSSKCGLGTPCAHAVKVYLPR